MEEDKVLLDYYTKRMATHTMITVAVVFGLFSLLWIISAFPLRTFAFYLMIKIGLTIGFIMLTLFGMYEIKRYKHYSSLARQKAGKFKADESGEKKEIIGISMKWIFPNAEILFGLVMFYFLVLVWLDFLVFFI